MESTVCSETGFSDRSGPHVGRSVEGSTPAPMTPEIHHPISRDGQSYF